MAGRHVDHLLIGGGIAAATCAATLREEGATGSVLLAGRELDPPYHRPPATKGYLLGREARADALIPLPGDVEVLTRTSVLELDPAARTAKLSTKEEVSFGTALVATGAMVRRLNVDGGQLDGIHYVRALGNADAIRRDLDEAERVVLVGGSFIACEVAASLTSIGTPCTMLMLEQEPMERQFGRHVGGAVRRLLESRGIEVHGGVDVERFAGEGERVEGVVLADGRTVPGQLVVCGTGAMPDVMLARKAGLAIGERGGVRCDAQLRTSAEGVWAAGDMCEFDSPLHGRVVRIEHEEVAAAQGRTAARNMLGAGVEHTEVPYFWTDLADWTTLEYVGPAERWDDEVVEGAPEEGAYFVWYLHEDRVVAALSAGGHGDLDRARELLASREPVGRAGL
ncbi:MAG: FAD-dependent oxidoreductase [Solirubrobacterales bacterium]|nr:FAD-dependent oxidoreductase [Solirubrobacterales bacterium]